MGCLFFLSSFSTTFGPYRHTGTRTLDVRVYTLTDMQYKEVPIAPRGGERTSGFPHGCRVKSVCMEDKPVQHLSLKSGHPVKQTNTHTRTHAHTRTCAHAHPM